ncbi:hypothetical protein TRIUR3_04486 [Triticum urartu]|uniref:F-box domain-containing protein n=1 Tax=Triticum urartu TaxID=4572 RepID=M8A5B3_TRIUA|nr:hypothetical protein TRIUR3_04486 [Triticum urartu]
MQAARGRRQTAASVPLDVLVEIAVRTDPATLVCCAATCVDMRRRVKDYTGLGGRLHLRHSDRFVLSLLRGHLIHTYKYDGMRRKDQLSLVDTTAADTATRRRVTGVRGFPLASSNGLVLTRVARGLCLWDPATSRSQSLPSAPTFPVDVVATQQDDDTANYVLLVGDGDDEGATVVGRQFHVVMAYLELSQHCRNMHFQIFSSEHGAWSRYNKIRVHKLQGSKLQRPLARALVVGDDAHWLCLTDKGDYVLKLQVRLGEQVTVTMLPENFPCGGWCHQLLATSSAGGCPIVLVTDGDKISVWAQAKQTGKWQRRPRMRSGTVLIKVLINMSTVGYFWLNLQSMKIVRWFSDRGEEYPTGNMPYEMNLAAWVPTFSSTL